MKDFLNRSVSRTGVLKVLIDLKCLQLVFLGERRLASLWSLLCNMSLKNHMTDSLCYHKVLESLLLSAHCYTSRSGKMLRMVRILIFFSVL